MTPLGIPRSEGLHPSGSPKRRGDGVVADDGGGISTEAGGYTRYQTTERSRHWRAGLPYLF
jgi:hypothetical protein